MSKYLRDKLFIFLFTIIASISNAEMINKDISKKYCSTLKFKIEDGIANYYAYNKQIGTFREMQESLDENSEYFLEFYNKYEKLKKNAYDLVEKWSEDIYKNSITWNNLCK